jgi:hypothetical protein
MDQPSQLDRLILDTVIKLFRTHWDKRRKIRLLGVALGGLGYGPGQEDLFEKSQRDKLGRLYQAADHVRDKYGFHAITSARTVK